MASRRKRALPKTRKENKKGDLFLCASLTLRNSEVKLLSMTLPLLNEAISLEVLSCCIPEGHAQA